MQIYDVDIDVVNKPFLPVASGELSKPAAWGLWLLLGAGALPPPPPLQGPDCPAQGSHFASALPPKGLGVWVWVLVWVGGRHAGALLASSAGGAFAFG